MRGILSTKKRKRGQLQIISGDTDIIQIYGGKNTVIKIKSDQLMLWQQREVSKPSDVNNALYGFYDSDTGTLSMATIEMCFDF